MWQLIHTDVDMIIFCMKLFLKDFCNTHTHTHTHIYVVLCVQRSQTLRNKYDVCSLRWDDLQKSASLGPRVFYLLPIVLFLSFFKATLKIKCIISKMVAPLWNFKLRTTEAASLLNAKSIKTSKNVMFNCFRFLYWRG